MAARDGDWSALWHNPAALTGSKPHMVVGSLFAFDDVNIRLKARPAGYDIADTGASSPQIPSAYRQQPRADTADIANTTDFVVGAVGSLGIEDLRIGVAAALPMTRLGLQQSHYADEREQYASNRLHFELLGARAQHQVILVGVAYRVLQRLSLGAAISVMPKGRAVSDVYLDDPTRQQAVRVVADNEQTGRVAPIFGIQLQATDGLRLGAGWRAANYFQLDVINRIQIKGFQGDARSFPIKQNVQFALNYTPETLAIGAQQRLGPASLAVEAVWSRWSAYIDTQGEKPRDWLDTISVRVGGDYAAAEGRTLRAGLQWEPSPVPPQTGRSNYVDNDRAVLALGGSHRISLLNQPVELGWALGVHHLLARDTNKAASASHPPCTAAANTLCDEVPDTTKNPATGQPAATAQGLQTGNPGFPGYASGGNLLSLAVDLKWEF